MKLAIALEVVRVARRQLGRRLTHCSEPMCQVCALLTIAAELDWQWANHNAAKALEQKTIPRPAESRGHCPHCGVRMIDGICGNCSG